MNYYQQTGVPVPQVYEQYPSNVPPPPYPPRPQQQEQPAQTLQEAFPTIHQSVIQATLASNRFQVEPAFNALLKISDPNAQSPPPPSQTHSYQAPGHTGFAHIHPSQGSQYGSALPSIPSTVSPGPPQIAYQQAHPYYGNQAGISPVPQFQNLSVNPSENQPQVQSQPPARKRIRHDVRCDGCGAFPVRGVRYRCTQCPDEDLCGNCFDAGILHSHKFEVQEPGVERHNDAECDGCKLQGRPIEGPRYQCRVHHDEDFCEKCVQTGKACSGPFKILKAAPWGKYLEEYGCVPVPQEWLPLLQPSTGYTYHTQSQVSKAESTWLDDVDTTTYDTVPARDQDWGRKSSRVYSIAIEKSKGHVVSNHKHTWTLKEAVTDTKLWTYTLETDRKTNSIKIETLTAHKGKPVSFKFSHGSQTDTLTFTNPADNRSYRWQTNHPVSTIYPSRYDTQRYALFESVPHSNQESIIADHTLWDGHQDNPEDALTIRTPSVDHALIIATLTVLHDHQRLTMQEEKVRDPDGVAMAEMTSRLTPLGRLAYWRASDFGIGVTGSSSSSRSKGQRLKNVTTALNVTKGVMQVANVINTVSTANAVNSANAGDASGGGACV